MSRLHYKAKYHRLQLIRAHLNQLEFQENII